MHTYNETCDACTLIGIDNGASPAGQCHNSVCFECEGMCKAVRCQAVVPFYCWSCMFVMGRTEQEAKEFHDDASLFDPNRWGNNARGFAEEPDKAARDARTGAELQRDTSLFPGMVKEDKDSLIKTASRFSDTIVPAGKPIDASLFDPNRWGNNERGFDKSPQVDFDVRDQIENNVNSSLASSAVQPPLRQEFITGISTGRGASADTLKLTFWPRGDNAYATSPLTPQEAFVAAGTELLEALDRFYEVLCAMLPNSGDIGHTEA